MTSDGWIEWTWTEEKPYPETLDTVVIVKYADGSEGNPWKVKFWHDAEMLETSNWYNADNSPASIVAYKVAK